MSKKMIEVFMKQKTANGGCGCSCNCSTKDYLPIGELPERFDKKYPDIGEFKIYELINQNRNVFLSRLNKVLENSGEKLIVNPMNMNFVLSKLLPLIAVDGMVVSVKNYPDEEQLYHAVTTGERMPTQSSCC